MGTADFTRAWRGRDSPTPGQAYAIVVTLSQWGDQIDEIRQRLTRRDEPLRDVRPFGYLDLGVMQAVGDDAVWAAKAAGRCRAVADEVARGAMPFDREGCFFDEVLIAAALLESPDVLADNPELFAGLPKRARDADWEGLAADVDDRARWDEWAVPVGTGSPRLPDLLRRPPPQRWFDVPTKGVTT